MFQYIPKHPISLIVGSREVEVQGVFEFVIQVEKSKAHYVLWIGSQDAKYFLQMPLGIKDAIVMTPTEIDTEVTILFGDHSQIHGVASKIAYQRKRHGYLLSICSNIDPNYLKKLKYNGPGKDQDVSVSRFDLMEL